MSRTTLRVVAGCSKRGVLVMALCIGLNVCGGGPTSPTGPTQAVPSTNANQWTVFGAFDLTSLSAEQDFLRGILNPGNLLIAECRVNGQLQNRLTFDPATRVPAGISCNPPLSMPSGRHTLAIRVVSHSRSPHTYAFGGTLFANRSPNSQTFECPRGNRSMVNGDEVTCSFTLP